MTSKEIRYQYKGMSLDATVKMISPLAWIFLVKSEHFAPFHLEYDEDRKSWEAIEDNVLLDKEIIAAIGKEVMRSGFKVESPVSKEKQSSSEFFIIDNGKEDIICFWNFPLRIRVSPVTGKALPANSAERLFYGSHRGSTLAFQTVDYKGEALETIVAAIRWYADHLGCSEMVISKDRLEIVSSLD